MYGDAGRIRQWILDPSCLESPQPQHATVASAASFALFSVARPGQLQRRAQLQAAADDFCLAKCDERSGDLDASLFRPYADDLTESVVILGAAVGVTGAVLRDRADVDLGCSQHLGPTDRCGKKMRIAEGDVGDGDPGADVAGFGDGDAFVSQRGPADLSEAAVLDEHALGDGEAVADLVERFALTPFGALAIADVHGGDALGSVL